MSSYIPISEVTESTTEDDSYYDYVIIGSGFGGSVSALRLSEKGYKVLVIEKGDWYHDNSYADTNWNLRRWLWLPTFGMRGIMKLTLFRHITVMSGVGVGGGSLTYGATLPTPKKQFFESGSWAGLQNWEQVLKPFYDKALTMLGARTNPNLTAADIVLKDLAKEIGREEHFHPSRVAIHFAEKGDEGKFVDDPYFDGEGPARKGCIECGACMRGCRHNAKNTLDKNYLYLAQKLGAKIIAQHEVVDVMPSGDKSGKQGYFVTYKNSTLTGSKKPITVRTKGVVFSGGVTGTVKLLLKLKDKASLPGLSDQVGADIRTNNETLTPVTAPNDDVDYATGVCIGSVLHTDDHSHLEPIVLGKRAAAWKLILVPRAVGKKALPRLGYFVSRFLRNPIKNLKVLATSRWGERSVTLLFMQHLEGSLKFKRSKTGLIISSVDKGDKPSATIAHSKDLTDKVEKIMGGTAQSSAPEVVLNTPATAHILGGAIMGKNAEHGVINDKCEVYGYDNMYVCDGSAISANPGVNPSLSITAVSEWAMSNVEPKQERIKLKDTALTVTQ